MNHTLEITFMYWQKSVVKNWYIFQKRREEKKIEKALLKSLSISNSLFFLIFENLKSRIDRYSNPVTCGNFLELVLIINLSKQNPCRTIALDTSIKIK